MPSHRGAHPQDEELFAPSQLPRLRAAVHDLSWLRSRQYGDAASLKLVGDRYRLKRRQRNAVARSSCSDEERAHRLEARLQPSAVSGQTLEIDAFNLLITVEGGLGGAYLFVGRDTAFRDVNPLQGTYRTVQETGSAIDALRRSLQELDVGGVTWHLDSHVSNVGRVKRRLEQAAPSDGLSWSIAVEENVDAVLKATSNPVATSYSAILDATTAWVPLEAVVVSRHSATANVIDLRPEGERGPLVPGDQPE